MKFRTQSPFWLVRCSAQRERERDRRSSFQNHSFVFTDQLCEMYFCLNLEFALFRTSLLLDKIFVAARWVKVQKSSFSFDYAFSGSLSLTSSRHLALTRVNVANYILILVHIKSFSCKLYAFHSHFSSQIPERYFPDPRPRHICSSSAFNLFI